MTKSAAYIEELLQPIADGETVFLDSFSEQRLQELLTVKCDFFLINGYDFLVGFLISHGRKAVSIVLYDGSGDMPLYHWQHQKGALLICLSETLHKRIQSLGIESVHSRYYPAEAEMRVTFDTGIRVFFWERTPSVGLSVRWVAQKLKAWLVRPNHVHLHLCPDPAEFPSVGQTSARNLFKYASISTSTWFGHRKDYEECLQHSNVFFAPRAAEGVGMSFLEAMSLGMVVIALDSPTMNEYIQDGINGILLKGLESELPDVSVNDLEKIGEAAHRSIAQGHEVWKTESARLANHIQIYARFTTLPQRDPIPVKEAARIAQLFPRSRARYLWAIYCADDARRRFLLRRVGLISARQRLGESWPVTTHLMMMIIRFVAKLLQTVSR
jgi:glycosyltransferase involved in cell wall biosynthesis